MRYIAAYLLATLGGNEQPKSGDLKKILKSVGIETEDKRLEALIAELAGKDINQVIAEGFSKLASMPSASAAPAASAAASGAPAASAAGKPAAKAALVEKEESDEEMGFGLFD